MVLKARAFHVLFPLLRHMVPLNKGSCHLTILVVKGRCARDVLLQAFEHIYNDAVNLIDNCDVAFDTNDWWSHPKTVAVIGFATHNITCPRYM